MTAEDLIRALSLKPLPWEGGYYHETWRSTVDIPKSALPAAYDGKRSAGTAIYYLLTPETVSRMHRLPSDETFHFYLGDAAQMLLLHPDGSSGTVVFGQNIMAGEKVQFTVPGNTWMGMRLLAGGAQGFALMGTTVSPGFDFADLEMPDGHDLKGRYPDRAELLEILG